jgi:hypothetical protein
MTRREYQDSQAAVLARGADGNPTLLVHPHGSGPFAE